MILMVMKQVHHEYPRGHPTMLPTVAAEDRDLMLRHPKEGKQQPMRKDVEATPSQAGYAASSLAYTDDFATG